MIISGRVDEVVAAKLLIYLNTNVSTIHTRADLVRVTFNYLHNILNKTIGLEDLEIGEAKILLADYFKKGEEHDIDEAIIQGLSQRIRL